MKTKNSNKSEFVTFMGINFPKVSNIDDLTVKHVRQYQEGAFRLLKSIPEVEMSFDSNWEYNVKYADKDSEVTCSVSDKAGIGVRTDLKSKSLVFKVHAMNITKEVTIPFKVLRALISLIAGSLILSINLHNQISAFLSSSLGSRFVKTFKGIKVKKSEEESVNSSISIKTSKEDLIPKLMKLFSMKSESKQSDSNKVHVLGKIDTSCLDRPRPSKSEMESRRRARREERKSKLDAEKLRYKTALFNIKHAVGYKNEIKLQDDRIDITIQDKLRSQYRDSVINALMDICKYRGWYFDYLGPTDKGVYIHLYPAEELYDVLISEMKSI